MSKMIQIANRMQDILNRIHGSIGFIGPLLLRLYLAPVFWAAANNKWNPFDGNSSLESTIAWFGNSDWGLGLPFPALNAYMAWSAEYFGAILLALGFGTRWISIPLMITMIVAMLTVHIEHGWQAVHDLKSPFASDNAAEALERLGVAKSLLKEQGNYDWLTEHGNLIASNNGVEWAATYFVMLLALFAIGGGKFVSVDFWLARKFRSS